MAHDCVSFHGLVMLVSRLNSGRSKPSILKSNYNAGTAILNMLIMLIWTWYLPELAHNLLHVVMRHYVHIRSTSVHIRSSSYVR